MRGIATTTTCGHSLDPRTIARGDVLRRFPSPALQQSGFTSKVSPADGNATTLAIGYFRGLSGLEQLRNVWEQLFQDCANDSFYNDWRWHYALQQHLIRTDICYVYVADGDRPVAILPLQGVVRRYGPLRPRILTFPYHAAVDLADMLLARDYEKEPVLASILRSLHTAAPMPWDFIQLAQFTSRSCLMGQLQLLGLESSQIGHRAYVESPSGRFLDELSKKQTRNVHRLCRAGAETLGECRWRTLSGQKDIAPMYEQFLKIESAGWKGEGGTESAIALRPDAAAFYAEILKSFGATEQAMVNILEFGQHAVAAQIGLRSNGIANLLKIGFDENFRACGPGAVALLKCLENETPSSREVSLVTSPVWAERWHFTQEPTYLLEHFRPNPYGRFVGGAYRTLRKLLGRIRELQCR